MTHTMRTLALALLTAISANADAETLAKSYKNVTGNPVSPCVFCADPTALEYQGRIYLYGSNDHQQYLKNGGSGGNGYGDIKSLVVFSTDDMYNWTFHGTIDVGKLCSGWGWRFAASWAPSVTWRTNAQGKDEFFLYFANSGGSIGVLKANSPLGPWTSPLSKPMIDADTPGVRPCNWIFDPGVVIDGDGTGWIAFGGGDPQPTGSALWPGNSRIAKLKPSMTAIDGSAVNMPAPYLFEASELNMMDGKYVYTYNTSWSDRNLWNTFTGRNGQPAPSSCSMCYMVSATPLDPDSWVYRGEYVPNEGSANIGADWGNNHTHLHKFGDQYYLFYHGNVLEKSMKAAGAMNNDASGYRSILVDKINVNEQTQTIGRVTMTTAGPKAVKTLDPYQEQQAETMTTCGGISYSDFKNIKTVTAKSNLGNDASQNMYVKMAAGAWTVVRNVGFGDTGASWFSFRAKGSGTLEIRFSKTGTTVATVDFSSTTMEDHVVQVDPATFKGTKKYLYLIFTQAENVQFDAWQFSLTDPSAINAVRGSSAQPSALFDLSGRRLPMSSADANAGSASHRGVVIEQFQDANGRKHSRKAIAPTR